MRRKKIKGKQSKLVTVPVKARSSKTHPEVHLAYITDKEQDLLIKKDLYKSLKGKPNRGPGGVPSLEGDFGSPTGQAYADPTSSYTPAGPDVSAQTATGEGGQTYTRTGGTKGTISTGDVKNVSLAGSILTKNLPGAVLNILSRIGGKKKDTSLKTDIKGIRQDPKTGATYHKAPRHRPVIDQGGDGGDGRGGTQMAATSAQATQPFL